MNRLVEGHGIKADQASFPERGRKHVEMGYALPSTRRRLQVKASGDQRGPIYVISPLLDAAE
jgi:hypothetical protein